MKPTPASLAQAYRSALRKHIQRQSAATLAQAQNVGRRAVVLRCGVLELARWHDSALAALGELIVPSWAVTPANAFFVEACRTIAAASPDARTAGDQVRELKRKLRARTAALAAARRHAAPGRAPGASPREGPQGQSAPPGQHHDDSRASPQTLRSLNRQMILAQEDERTTISQKLHNDIAQELLAIQVRLVALKKEAARRTFGLKRNIGSAQRLVRESARTLDRWASGFR